MEDMGLPWVCLSASASEVETKAAELAGVALVLAMPGHSHWQWLAHWQVLLAIGFSSTWY